MADDDEGGDWEGMAQSVPSPVKPLESKGRGRGRGGRGRGMEQKKQPCICCDDPRVNNTRFCAVHKRSYDSMRYQMQAQKDDDLAAIFEENMYIVTAYMHE